MKKNKIIVLLSTLSIGLALTGCSVKMEKFDKQIEQLDELIKGSDIYNEDYKFKYTQTFKVQDEFDQVEYIYIKDDNKIQGDEYIGDDLHARIWFVPENENNYIRAVQSESDNVITKTYKEYNEDEALNEVKETKEKILKKIYTELTEAVNECKLDDDDCSINKKLFNKKYNFEAEIEINENEKKIVKATIENGRILDFELIEKVMNKVLNKIETNTINFSIEYNNQTVEFKRTNEFTLIK